MEGETVANEAAEEARSAADVARTGVQRGRLATSDQGNKREVEERQPKRRQSIDEAVRHYTAQVKREEAAEQCLRIQDWRNRMRSGVAEVSRHLRKQRDASTRLPERAKMYGRPQKSLRPKPSWIYRRPCSIPCCSIYATKPSQLGRMRRSGRQDCSCGGDGWHRDEIAVLPGGPVGDFYTVLRSWVRNGVVPQNMGTCVQAMMPRKPPTIANPRLLSLQSAWWRAFESGMLQTSFSKDWRKEVGINQVAFREAVEHCAALAATNFEEQKFWRRSTSRRRLTRWTQQRRGSCFSAQGSR